ncbi:MAG: hypothetical protein ACR2PF_05320 [Rhizobiaceae bacterium]
MTEVVILISSLIFADLQDGAAGNATAEALLREIGKYGAVVNYDSSFTDPERSGAVYLTILIDNQAQQFAEIVRDLDGVYSCYVKPGAELP